MVTINATLEPEEEKELLEFLRKNQDVFAWSASDLRGVSRDIIEHRLDNNPNIKPKKQKLRKMADEKAVRFDSFKNVTKSCSCVVCPTMRGSIDCFFWASSCGTSDDDDFDCLFFFSVVLIIVHS